MSKSQTNGKGTPEKVMPTEPAKADEQENKITLANVHLSVENLAKAAVLGAISAEQAAAVLNAYLDHAHPNGMTGHSQTKTVAENFKEIRSYVRMASPDLADVEDFYAKLLAVPQTVETYSHPCQNATGGRKLGQQQFSGHYKNGIAKAYVGLYGEKAQIGLVPDCPTGSTRAKEAQAEKDKAELAQKQHAAHVKQVSAVMADVFKSGDLKKAAKGKTAEVLKIMNGYDAARAEAARKEFEALQAKYGEYRFYEYIPTGPEHAYTEQELKNMPELTFVMGFLEANDADYAKAFGGHA